MKLILHIVLCALISICEINVIGQERITGYVPDVGRTVRPRMKVLAEEDRGTYVCQMVEYSVDASYVDDSGRTRTDRERIKGYLLVPDLARKSRCPALVMLHDHGARFDIGKEKLVRPIATILPQGLEDHIYVSSSQWIDKNFDGVYLADYFASIGYVVFVSDALYWGDRSSADAHRWSELMYGQNVKGQKDTLKALKKRVYEGQRDVYKSLEEKGIIWAEKVLRDDIASVRLLNSLSYVDSSRIGAFGFSMGAHRCWLLAAFCREVKCGVALSWMTSLDGYDGNNASDLSMRIQPMRDYLDFGDIGRYLAPKPMLFLSGKTDHLFPQPMVQKAYGKLHTYYKDTQCLRTEFFEGGHHCGKPVQKIIADYFDIQLKPTIQN